MPNLQTFLLNFQTLGKTIRMCNLPCDQHRCPFAFTEESEIVQNYGCLPTPADIISMRVKYGKTWACHSTPTRPCVGAIKYMKKEGIDCSVIDDNLVTEESDWTQFIK